MKFPFKQSSSGLLLTAKLQAWSLDNEQLLTVQTVESTIYQKVTMNSLIKGLFSIGYSTQLLIYPYYPLPRTIGLNTWPRYNSWLAVFRQRVFVWAKRGSVLFSAVIATLSENPVSWWWAHHYIHTPCPHKDYCSWQGRCLYRQRNQRQIYGNTSADLDIKKLKLKLCVFIRLISTHTHVFVLHTFVQSSWLSWNSTITIISSVTTTTPWMKFPVLKSMSKSSHVD